MKPSEIRAELLGQHATLRSLIEQTKRASEQPAPPGEVGLDRARDCLVRLVDELRRHNLREEELLRDVIPSVDPWGPARAEIMTEEHVKEHQELFGALTDATATTDARAAAPMLRIVCERLLAHMAREERDFLGGDCLRDDQVSVDSFGG